MQGQRIAWPSIHTVLYGSHTIVLLHSSLVLDVYCIRTNSYLIRLPLSLPSSPSYLCSNPTVSPNLSIDMGNSPSVVIDPKCNEEKIAQDLLAFYLEDSAKFQRVVATVEVAGRSKKPKFPSNTIVADIPPVPAAEVAAFKAKHVNLEKMSYSDPEAKDRLKNRRNLQYDRWDWACANMGTYINMMRVCGHSDEKIQAMIDGTPMCFATPEDYRVLRAALKKLGDDIEAEMGWTNVNFVITGSSVPGFSQNPIKGFASTPSKITNATKSDVDISIVGDGINTTMTDRLEAGLPEPKRCFATTCSATTDATRFGCKDISAVCKAAHNFYVEWSERLPGGLQFTFCEDDNPTPPWEARIDTTEV